MKCPDFKPNKNGKCIRYIKTKDPFIGVCEYKESEEDIKDEHFICEYSEEYRKELIKNISKN